MSKIAIAALVSFCLLIPIAAVGQDETLMNGGNVWSVPEFAYPTSGTGTNRTIYGPRVVDCRQAKGLALYVTVAGANATSKATVLVNWLLADPTAVTTTTYPLSAPYGGSYLNNYVKWGLALPSPHYQFNEIVFLQKDGLTTGVTECVAVGKYLGSVVPKAPYARIAVTYAGSDYDELKVGVWCAKRYQGWPEFSKVQPQYEGAMEMLWTW